MREIVYLVVNRNKVDRINKNLPSIKRGEIIVKLTVNVADKCFGTATIPQEIFIEDWRDGVDMEDVEFNKNLITREESEIIKQKRLDKMKEILENQGYTIEKPEEKDE